MNEKLIAGYAAYTTADEYGTAATDDAPAVTPIGTVTFIVTPWAAATGGGTIIAHC